MLANSRQSGFTLVEIMIVVAIIGLLAAIAIPNFIKFQAKSKQSEAKTNLKAIFTAERVAFSEHDSYGNFSNINYAPDRGNRYAYTIVSPPGESLVRQTAVDGLATTSLGFDRIEVDCFRLVGGTCTVATPGAPLPGGNTAYAAPSILASPGVSAPSAPPGLVIGGGGSVIVQAVGNVDNDSGADTWDLPIGVNLVQSGSVCGDSVAAPSGQPVNSWNDSVCD